MPKNSPRVIDANILVRYLTSDSPKLIPKIKRLIQHDRNIIVPDVAVAEIVWVLKSFYQIPKEEIVDKLLALMESPALVFNKSLITKALLHFKETTLDYIDAYLIAYAQEETMPEIISYDRNFDKIKEIKRVEP